MLYRRTTPAEVLELERDPDLAGLWIADGPVLDLGTAWHGVHFLLNGSAWGGAGPLFDAVLGGTQLGDPTSYEPVRYVSAEQVAAVAAALPGTEKLTPRFTHKAMKQAELYPDAAWDEPDVLTTLLLPAYAQLVELFAAAAAASDGVLITLDRS